MYIRQVKTKVSLVWEHLMERLQPDLRQGEYLYLTGGAISSMLLGREPRDWDIYASSNALAKRVVKSVTEGRHYPRNIMLEEVQNCTIKEFLNTPMKELDIVALFITDNATLVSIGGLKVQFITRFFGSPKEVHKNFDFVHATPYFKDGKLCITKDAALSILGKTLIYIGSLYPVATLIRLRKFLSRGWKISGGELIKIAFNLSQFDLSNPLVLAEQIQGIDILILADVVEWLKNHNSITITREWLDGLISRAFEEGGGADV